MNRRVQSIPPSATLAITSRLKQMAADGEDVCNFAAGEPDFDTPEHIKSAAQEALASGKTKYGPQTGLKELREAIARKLETENGLSYGPDRIVISNGAKQSLFNVLMALCDRGDEVVIPSPYWLSYPEMVRISGAEPVFIRGRQTEDFKLSPGRLEGAVTDRTRAVILNSPSNPLGIVYSEDELRGLADVAVRHGIMIISDEIYEKLVYDGATHTSVGSFSPEVQELTVTVNGFSKAWSMTGWRLGYAAAPADLVKAMSALQSHSTSGPNTFAQYGALAALSGGDDVVTAMVEAFSDRREHLYGRLQSMSGVSCVKPSGAFYAFPNVSAYGLDSVTFAGRLLEEARVGVVPGMPFGTDEHVRLSYACSMEDLEKGADRMERFLATLPHT
jgi:aspartate aminotransferase